MAKDIQNKKRGVVLEALPGTRFKVEVNGKTVLCYLAGKMLITNIRVTVNDKVDVIVPPNSDRGRIVWRY